MAKKKRHYGWVVALVAVLLFVAVLGAVLWATRSLLKNQDVWLQLFPGESTTAVTADWGLDITSHERTSTTVEDTTVFEGTCNPEESLLLNGKSVKRDKEGAFSVEMPLKVGKNTFVFTYKGEKTTYTVQRKYAIIQGFTPSGSYWYQSGATFGVSVTARRGSTVTATFRGSTTTLKAESGTGTFVRYTGRFGLPGGNKKDLNLGPVKFKATYQGKTDTAQSGDIVCQKEAKPTVGEIVTFSAETFNGEGEDDASRPTNNYLPRGTVDYVVGRSYWEDKEFVLLRCGRRVYVGKTLEPSGKKVRVVRERKGSLPATNTLNVRRLEVGNRATTLTLDTNWKAPFLLDVYPQRYQNPAAQNYTISRATGEYVQITFCYANALKGDIAIPSNHPLFSSARVTRSDGECVLRLYLKKTGAFYGWDAFYNGSGQLVFQFLHPARVTPANNEYGANLLGVKIMLDVGHGGYNKGASGLNANHPESERNMNLARLLKTELESMGATVILNRDDSTALDSDRRCRLLKQVKPDLCIAIHHDASGSSSANGFGSYYFSPRSYQAAKCIYDATMQSGIYRYGNRNKLSWHYYFVGRMTDCPVVLTENGFMTSPRDHTGIISQETNRQKAKAIAQGTADYFLSLP